MDFAKLENIDINKTLYHILSAALFRLIIELLDDHLQLNAAKGFVKLDFISFTSVPSGNKYHVSVFLKYLLSAISTGC